MIKPLFDSYYIQNFWLLLFNYLCYETADRGQKFLVVTLSKFEINYHFELAHNSLNRLRIAVIKYG
jgi:hypothetical protein